MMSDYQLKTISALSAVSRTAWDAVANPPSESYDPFLSWDFLEAMESSGAASTQEGWTPAHIIIEGENGELRAAMPLYAKTHSQGEYVFDHSWADAYERAGGDYYPKLLSAIPFTPVTGRRRLVRDGEMDPDGLRDALLLGAVKLAEMNQISSLHLNFLTEKEYVSLGEAGLLQRTDRQFHFENGGYADFDDFLSKLSSAKRKNLRKERKKAQEGLTFLHLSGDDILPEHWDHFFEFYMDTGSRKWGFPYLNRETFELLHERMRDKMLLIFACDDGLPIAGALNFIGSDTLYGRYWGRRDERPFLHFEVCYYQAIDYAIAHNLKRVEAGAQGGHKLARGYGPAATYSAHWIGHEGLRYAIDQYLEQERAAVIQEHEYLETRQPFKKTGE
ncbi:GNAT family N-acetyltransferase [Ponticaulis sp.]|uniref:GNAT family N-acetyltransferase n=1 Tax=Ponticaulis sp. TaxID=2020902 RepID=UPI0025FE902D|nr:GNAT family N-acetyltransferase [Ponticaulis sp.]|tara:strand:- start:155887 stop:157053 length:1167 start_codon:yes stop_codon:yes gene_type:complete